LNASYTSVTTVAFKLKLRILLKNTFTQYIHSCLIIEISKIRNNREIKYFKFRNLPFVVYVSAAHE
jgi:hypothetical protein